LTPCELRSIPGRPVRLIVPFAAGGPSDVIARIDKLNAEINAGLVDPKMKARLADLDGTVLLAPLPTSASSSLTKPRNGER
jgi:hypothetical protein